MNRAPRPDRPPVPTNRPIAIKERSVGDDVLMSAHVHIDTQCVVDLTITGRATVAGKARLIRMIELAMDVHIQQDAAHQEE